MNLDSDIFLLGILLIAIANILAYINRNKDVSLREYTMGSVFIYRDLDKYVNRKAHKVVLFFMYSGSIIILLFMLVVIFSVVEVFIL